MSFLDNRHHEWTDKAERWVYAWDNYTGECFRHDTSYLNLLTTGKGKEKEHKYLHRKVQAETNEAYYERILTTDPVLLFATAIDSLNGILFSNEKDTEREWGAFGDVEEKDSVAYQLWHDADGNGTNWEPLMKQTGIRQTVMHRVWGLVDGATDTSDPSLKIINPQSVVNWYPNAGNPTEVLVREKSDLRASIKSNDDEADVETYVFYTLDGWQRLKNGEGGVEVVEEGDYAYYTDSTRSQRRLPIFSVQIPMPRDLGYLLAMKQNHIFNAKSIRDFSVRNMSFAFLKLVADQNQFDEFIANISKGFRVIRQDPDASGSHEFIAPPADYLTEAGEILEADKKNFMESAFRSYGDAAKQVTATEIRQESRSGVEAFLSLLVTTIDEFENAALFLLEQAYFSESPGSWGQAYVQRKNEFKPEDINEAMEKVSSTVDKAKRANAMSTFRAVQLLNKGWTDEEIQEEVERINAEMGASVPDPFNND